MDIRSKKIQKDLFKLEQCNDIIETYYHKLKGLWDELSVLEPVIKCTCGVTKEWDSHIEETRLNQFLMGFHSGYIVSRGHLLMMNPWPTINQAYMLTKQKEKQWKVTSSDTPIAMMVSTPILPHINTNSQRTSNDNSVIILEYTYCHGKNHTKDKCYKLVGYPPSSFQSQQQRKKEEFYQI